MQNLVSLNLSAQDLAALDALRPRLLQLQQLVERAEDTETALVSVALEGYGLLNVSDKSEALKDARQALSARFAKSRRAPEPATVD